MSDYLGKEFKKLGFGFMRLPMIGNEIDMEQTKIMTDMFMEKGFTYFDTAYVYIDGRSEVAIKEAVVDRYPRESFQVATKLPLWGVKEPEEMETLFTTSLERAGLEYYDFYLLHCLDKARVADCDRLGAWDYMKSLKADGRAKHIGFSFHDTADVLEEILENHPEMEFVQLQINYIDWEDSVVQARKCYELAIKYNKPIIIMEPVRGGVLANIVPKADEILKEYNPTASAASWAIRYTASLDNIVTVLSGMSNIEQMQDNLSYMDEFVPLSDEEQKVIDKVVEEIEKTPLIPCTDCKYCVEGCPMNIDIPGLFKVNNYNQKFGGEPPINKQAFENTVKEKGKPSECVSCGACEDHCPQHIAISEELCKMANAYE